MKLLCAPQNYPFAEYDGDVVEVVLYGHADIQTRGHAGAAIKDEIAREKLLPATRAWDLLSTALAVTAADLAGSRTRSPDGWTRQLDLEIAVADPEFWNEQSTLISKLLGFLTTDLWSVKFIADGFAPTPEYTPTYPEDDCVALLSGGLDSFVGAIDLVEQGKHPFVVSQIVRGDADKQRGFAQMLGGGLRHLQLNHNAEVPDPETPPSQRARSFAFITYGILAATTLESYHAGGDVVLYVCENGFISINAPLTGARLGSLSTRTTHPVYFGLIHELLAAAGLRVRLQNPYQLKTKGEMLRECLNQTILRQHAHSTTSCGRFLQYGYTHCGRCMPCLVRRAAFRAWGVSDTTKPYVFNDLGRDDADHAGFDDVRCVAMAVAEVSADGLENWLGTALSTALIADVSSLQAMAGRGLDELAAFLTSYGVK